jgi:hypothetical protein
VSLKNAVVLMSILSTVLMTAFIPSPICPDYLDPICQTDIEIPQHDTYMPWFPNADSNTNTHVSP